MSKKNETVEILTEKEATDIGNFIIKGLMIAHLFAIFGLILLGMLGLFIWL